MSPMLRLCLAALLVPAVATPGWGAPGASPPVLPTPAAAPPGTACEGQAARYENGKGFTLFAIRAGEMRIDNPLRPLTPDFTHVLEVIVGGKRATAYGPDYESLRRGGPPGAMQASLGAPITWAPSLPALPEKIGIVAEDGVPLAALAFRACEPAPAAAPEAPPRVAKKGGQGGRKAGAAKPAAGGGPAKPVKTPSGFTMPSGAIPE
jgi:hypothetical protein